MLKYTLNNDSSKPFMVKVRIVYNFETKKTTWSVCFFFFYHKSLTHENHEIPLQYPLNNHYFHHKATWLSSPGRIHPGQPICRLCEARGAVKRQTIAGTCRSHGVRRSSTVWTLEKCGKMWETCGNMWKKWEKCGNMWKNVETCGKWRNGKIWNGHHKRKKNENWKSIPIPSDEWLKYPFFQTWPLDFLPSSFCEKIYRKPWFLPLNFPLNQSIDRNLHGWEFSYEILWISAATDALQQSAQRFPVRHSALDKFHTRQGG